jgi:serine/threonine protein kinase/nitrous oxidase accessory protein NosD
MADEEAAKRTDEPEKEGMLFGHFVVPRRADGSLWELGRGAMGVTYRAFDTSLRIDVALKVIAASRVEEIEVRRRFQREARAAAKIHHPNVASALYLGEQGGEFFYAMEFIPGRSLEAFLKEQAHPLSPAVAAALAAQAAAGLNAAHKREVVHRDLKPANLMLLEGDALDHEDERTAAAGNRQLKIIDFGLARSVSAGRDDESLVTQTVAGFIGTPAYASPEQCSGESDLDGRADLYSLGVILWQMLVGSLPFSGRVAEVIGKHQFQPPPFHRLDEAMVPAALVSVLQGLLTKAPDERQPQTAAALRSLLDRILRGLVSGTEVPASPAEAGVPPVESLGRTLDTTLLPTAGTTLLKRYRLERRIAHGVNGHLFLATDNAAEGRSVAVKLLSPERLNTEPGFLSELQTRLATAHDHPHPTLLTQFSRGPEHSDATIFYVREWAQGFSLDELLRARHGELKAAEVFRLLETLPEALDFATLHGFSHLAVGLHKIFVVPASADPGASVDWPALRTQPVPSWPSFALKVNPVGFPPPALFDTDAQLTLVAGRWEGGSSLDAADPVAALARLLRELLGAARDSLGPVAALNDQANVILRRALDPSETAGGPNRRADEAATFWRELRQAADVRAIAKPPGDGAGAGSIAKSQPNTAQLQAMTGLRPMTPPGAISSAPNALPPAGASKRKVFLLGAGALVLLLALATVWWLTTRKSPPPHPAQPIAQSDEPARHAFPSPEDQEGTARRLREEQENAARQAVAKAQAEHDAAAALEQQRQDKLLAPPKDDTTRRAQPEDEAANPKVLNVPRDFVAIQQALDSAKPGDTVIVAPGTYTEALKMNKENVWLQGVDRDRVVIRWDASRAPSLTVKSCRAGRVTGLTFAQTGPEKAQLHFSAIFVVSSDVEIQNCTVSQSRAAGILIRGSSGEGKGPTVRGCTVDGCAGDGILVAGPDARAVINDNHCRKNTGCGIHFGQGASGTAEGNTCEENSTGILLEDRTTTAELRRNECRQNTEDGIGFDQGASGSAEGNTCEDNTNSGILVAGQGAEPNLSGNHCSRNGWGILKKDGARPVIAKDNVVFGNLNGQVCYANPVTGKILPAK